jgi:hypothetical protein
MYEPLTREELNAMMEESFKKISSLVDERVEEALHRQRVQQNGDFQSFRRNYKVYNATTVPILPRGSMVLIDTRAVLGASGVVAKYSSLGDRWVEEWAKQVNP